MSNALPIVGLALMLAAPATKEAKKDTPSIIGEWVCETVTSNGRTEPRAGAKAQLVYTFSADGKLVIGEGGVWSKSEYKAVANKEPAELDWGDPAMPTLAIYKIEKDALTLCYPGPKPPGARKGGPAARPTAFKATAGTGQVLMTFKRVEKKKE
jgi:uncharacterized protein (TIGR03067 family)